MKNRRSVIILFVSLVFYLVYAFYVLFQGLDISVLSIISMNLTTILGTFIIKEKGWKNFIQGTVFFGLTFMVVSRTSLLLIVSDSSDKVIESVLVLITSLSLWLLILSEKFERK